MKKFFYILIIIILTSLIYAETKTIYVSATKNCLGPGDGKYKRMRVPKNVTYVITVKRMNAVFNTDDNAKFGNVVVMYVEPPRKMMIKTIKPGEKTYVTTEGNLLFFFVDDPDLNKGGALLEVKRVNK